MHFGRGVAPGGFGWVVPVWRGDRSFARVGVMAERHAPAHFARMLERVCEPLGRLDGIDGAAAPEDPAARPASPGPSATACWSSATRRAW